MKADDLERPEPLTLGGEDVTQPRDVGLGVDPVARGRSLRRDQTFGLQETQLGDSEVRKVPLKSFEDDPDRQTTPTTRHVEGQRA